MCIIRQGGIFSEFVATSLKFQLDLDLFHQLRARCALTTSEENRVFRVKRSLFAEDSSAINQAAAFALDSANKQFLHSNEYLHRNKINRIK
jgi:hypothetical protein